jgi:hypothetical protein
VNTLVVPTARPRLLFEFLEQWRPWPWDAVIVVEDGPEITIDEAQLRALADGRRLELFSWAEIEAELSAPWIISKQDSAIRAFGFWKAWQQGADVVFTLDDDCHRMGDGFVEAHLANLAQTPVWQSTVPGLRVRGLPYRNFGTLDNVAVSIGLWVGNPDLDAVQTLANGITPADVELVSAVSTRVLPSEQYFPISGMNLAFRRDVACLMYYPPMGLNSPYARFDDIWSGLVMQRVCRHLRLPIVCGQPLVDHRRASDPFANLEKESPGLGANERIWELVDAIELGEATPLACMREMGAGLERGADGDEYVGLWGRAILEWCELFGQET